jgi:hypothetical protein
MEPLALVAVQFMLNDARSALPDAPVVDDSPSKLSRMLRSATRLTEHRADRRGFGRLRGTAPAVPAEAK